MVYFSEFNVVPLLLVVNTLLNVVPSVDVSYNKIILSGISNIPCNVHATNTLN